MLSAFLSRIIILVGGTLYPAYASYKAVKTKDLKEYVKWMMYWIVFALFITVETFADVLFAFWMPLYYEIKIVFLFWLLSPLTKGSSCLYRKFVHPQLSKHERDIDELIAKTRAQSYSTLVNYGAKGLTLASKFVADIALKGQYTLMNQLKKSQSLNDISPAYGDVEPRYYQHSGSLKGRNPYYLTTSGTLRSIRPQLIDADEDDMYMEEEGVPTRGSITFDDGDYINSKSPSNKHTFYSGAGINNTTTVKYSKRERTIMEESEEPDGENTESGESLGNNNEYTSTTTQRPYHLKTTTTGSGSIAQGSRNKSTTTAVGTKKPSSTRLPPVPYNTRSSGGGTNYISDEHGGPATTLPRSAKRNKPVRKTIERDTFETFENRDSELPPNSGREISAN